MEQKDILTSIRDVSTDLQRQDSFIPQVGENYVDREVIKEAVALFKHIVFGNIFGTIDQYTSLSRLYSILCKQIEYTDLSLGQVQDAGCVARQFIESIPDLRHVLGTDAKAICDGDPAATGIEEVILCYPALEAMVHFRMAHCLLELGVPLLPRIITERAHSLTGIDIHPGARIGEFFGIDHGTGVVIGETSIIGNHVQLYQGVTLGAKSFKFDSEGKPINLPRHPIIEDNVIIYSNTSVLGRITIGHDSIIGGNVWLTQDLPPYSKYFQSRGQ